eukprot:295737-Lingulodinium_polyedra.AAC.1
MPRPATLCPPGGRRGAVGARRILQILLSCCGIASVLRMPLRNPTYAAGAFREHIPNMSAVFCCERSQT